MSAGGLDGVGALLRHQLRRDRIFLPLWLVGLVSMVAASAATIDTVYSTESVRVTTARGLNSSAASVALYGPILDVHSAGELAMTKMTVLYAVFAALMAVFLVRRHTRLAEERGLLELIGGTAVGRHAPVAAALAEAVLVAVVLGALSSLCDLALGLPVRGSALFGASWAGCTLVGAAIGLVCCQLSASARACSGIASATIGVLYALRAAGDVSDADWLGWLSPFGWNTRLRAWGEPRWGLLAAYVVTAFALVALALALRARRDLGSGLLQSRPGRRAASPRLASPLALTVRTHQPMLLGWTLGSAVEGFLFGMMAPSLGGLFDTPQMQRVLASLGGTGVVVDQMMAAMLALGAVLITCFAVAVVGHGAADEHSGRAEELLSSAASRSAVLGASVLVALGGAIWLLLVLGASAGIGWGMAGDGLPVLRLTVAALASAPAVCLVASLAALLYGTRSRWSPAGWGLVAGFLVLGTLAQMLQLPDWVARLSPYENSPRLPGGEVGVVPLLVMSALSVAALGLTWWRYRSRDVG